MRREDFFTGEPEINSGSPSFSEFTSETEAIQNASFGKYDYDPGARMMSQPVSIYPGGYGYNPNTNFNNYMNPPSYYNYPVQQQGYYGGGNPALYYQQQQQMQYQQQMQQELKYYIPPVNLSGSEYLPSLNYEEEIEQLKLDYWMKEQEMAAKNSINNANSSYNPFTGYNYYGVPYYNPYQYNSINAEISQKIQDIQNAARENRINFNLHLATLAHNYVGHTYNEDELRERYTGKSVSYPTPITYADIYEQQRFSNMVPFDNSQFYRDHHEAVSREYNSVISKDADMKECFDNMGVLYAKYEMEEEQHRRRNGATLYNSEDNSYKYFVKTKAAERYAKNNGLPLTKIIENNDQFKQSMLGGFPTLAQSAKLCDDGTLNITCNFGSKAGQVYSVHNSQEAEYNQSREKFQQFIDSIPGSIYLDSPNPT